MGVVMVDGSTDNGSRPQQVQPQQQQRVHTTTPVFTDGACNGLSPGDVMITAFNSDNPDAVDNRGIERDCSWCNAIHDG